MIMILILLYFLDDINFTNTRTQKIFPFLVSSINLMLCNFHYRVKNHWINLLITATINGTDSISSLSALELLDYKKIIHFCVFILIYSQFPQAPMSSDSILDEYCDSPN